MNKKIMRIIGALLLTTALVVSLIPVSDVEASSFASDFQITGNKLMRYIGTDEIVSIPDTVKSIEVDAFKGNANIVKVEIGDKCEKIGYGAFSNCPNLRTVVLSDSVTELDSAAFANDISLTNFTIGAGLKKIGSGVFAGDKSLSRLSVSSNNKYLKLYDNVLYDDEMTKLYYMLPTFIDPEFQIPNSVTEIAGYAFWGNTSLINVSLSSNMYTVPEFAFSNCVNLKQVLTPLTLRKIDSKAFEDCVNLTSIKLPESVNYISDSAFDGCPNVSINATLGTYAYNYGQKLLKDKIDEIEYEDVSDYQVVTSTTEKSIISSLDDTQTEVVEGHPEHDVEGADDLSDNSLDNNSNNNEYNSNPVTVNNEAKYYNGVISGADVVSYSYYNAQENPEGTTLGTASVVGGNALVFIDNSNARVKGYQVNTFTADSNNNIVSSDDSQIDSSNNDDENINSAGTIDLNNDNIKSVDFPKFTIAGNNIASQSFYNDKSIKDFEVPENITRIGDFAFSRSGLNKIIIPEGVTEIGYGAFYHCDDLREVVLPSTIEHVSSYAFSNTPLVEESLDSFLILGDGVLVSYKGNDSVVNIPDDVKIIADGCFMDRKGITAVNFPDSLRIIGDDAFYGCTNLRTFNRGDYIEIIGANAFSQTALNNVTIPASVKSIGIGAFNLINGTDTVTFKGGTLPELTLGYDASRLSDDFDRTYAFGNISTAVVQGMVKEFNNTVLEPGKYGFKGIVKNEGGAVVLDNSQGVLEKNDNVITLKLNSAYIDGYGASAYLAGNNSSFYLSISDSQNSKEKIANAYAELYGGKRPEDLLGFDIELLDASGTLPITKLGKQKVSVTVSIPSIYTDKIIKIVCLDEDGQLENVEAVKSEDGKSITFTCKHFSPYGFYVAGDEIIVKEGTRIKDNTPDTGDLSIHPKFILAIGIAALGLVIFLLSYKKKNNVLTNVV